MLFILGIQKNLMAKRTSIFVLYFLGTPDANKCIGVPFLSSLLLRFANCVRSSLSVNAQETKRKGQPSRELLK